MNKTDQRYKINKPLLFSLANKKFWINMKSDSVSDVDLDEEGIKRSETALAAKDGVALFQFLLRTLIIS